jgi:hypothetical protein
MSRFSLRSLLMGVAFVAVAIVATMNANRAWVAGIEALAYLFLCTAMVGALWATGERRAFWGGCAVFGWALWLAGSSISYVNLPGWRLGEVIANELHQVYQTDGVVQYDEYNKHRHELRVISEHDQNGIHYYRVRNSEYASRLGQATGALLVIVAGVIGGAISAWFWRAGRGELRSDRHPAAGRWA